MSRLRLRDPLTSGHLGDYAFDPAIDRGDGQHMAAAVARSPHADAACVDLGMATDPGDRVAIVAHLLPRIDFLTRFAVARAEIAIVVNQRGKAGLAEDLGEAIEIHFLDGGEAVRHHDRGHAALGALGQIEPSAESRTFGVEFDVTAHNVTLARDDSRISERPEGKLTLRVRTGAGWRVARQSNKRPRRTALGIRRGR